MKFDDAQRQALNKLKNGCILCGGVGSGKSRTALAYYYVKECGGSFEPNLTPMKNYIQLVIITTAKKRDTKEWDSELREFDIDPNSVIIDSWNNIGKYTELKDSFIIFDEQRLVGSGAWVKAFYKIVKKNGNHWILLSATPGDTWSDYIPVFVANGFYKNKTEFLDRHVIFDRFSKFNKIRGYYDERILRKYRDSILVDIPVIKHTHRNIKYVDVKYDEETFKYVMKNRWDVYSHEPIKDAGALCYILRRIVNENPERILAIRELIKTHPKVIIFYNFDYELDLLRDMCRVIGIEHAEWNGHKHESVPTGSSWVYLTQYTAGAEGWNCITTDAIIFYSYNYSYKITEQSMGRIDRRDTPYVELYYYFLRTTSWIDRAINGALRAKKKFNETKFCSKLFVT